MPSSSTEVALLKPADHLAWDQYLGRVRTSSFSQTTGWLKVVSGTYGHRPLYLVARRMGKIVGGIPLFLVQVPFVGRYLASDLFSSYGGMLASDDEAAGRLLESLENLTEELGVRYVEIKDSVERVPHTGAWSTRTSYCTMKLDIGMGSEQLWKQWKGKNRTDVRKARKSGVTAETGPDLFEEFYSLVALNMKILGTPVHARSFYGNILESFPKAAKLHVARVAGQAVAAMLTIGHNGCIHALTSVADPTHRPLKPTTLLYWHIIEAATQEGYSSLDFGRSTWESGTYDYKRHLGAEAETLYYTYHHGTHNQAPEVNHSNPTLRLATKVWQKLPLPVTNLIGPRLIRYIS